MTATPPHDPAAEVVERARSLSLDLELTEVKRWKAENPGSLAIGHMPIYAPRPLLEALGCLPVAVFGGGDEIDIIRGDSYFQSYICHIPRSTVELGISGHLDPLDGMVFPSICDVIRNLGGMWKLLFPERYTAYLDLPQNFNREIGGRFYAHELRRIATEITALGALPLDPARLRQAIEDDNRRRRSIVTLDAMRCATPWLAPASEAYLVVRAGSVLMASEHADLIDSYIALAGQRDKRPLDNVRVVLIGAFCEQPPMGLIISLERAGCDIIADDFQHGARTIVGDVLLRDDEDPLDTLSQCFLDQGVATASRYIADDEKGGTLVAQVAETRADGVIFAAASFCDPALLDQPMLEAACTAASIPFTAFKYSENTGQFQVIREQAGAFSDSVKLWGDTSQVTPSKRRAAR